MRQRKQRYGSFLAKLGGEFTLLLTQSLLIRLYDHLNSADNGVNDPRQSYLYYPLYHQLRNKVINAKT